MLIRAGENEVLKKLPLRVLTSNKLILFYY